MRTVLKNPCCEFGFGDRRKFMLNLLYLYHLPARMESWCILGEKYGLRYTYPLLDKDLIEFWFSVPPLLTAIGNQNRYLFRESLKGILTESVRVRPTKEEAVFQSGIAFTAFHGMKWLIDAYEKIPPDHHLSMFNQIKLKQISEKYRKMVRPNAIPEPCKYPNLFRDSFRLSFYLRCYKLKLKLNR
jgi:asparagine synthase (glutamine-hydrolysing)